MSLSPLAKLNFPTLSMLDAEGEMFLSLVVGPLKKQVHEEFLRFAGVDDSPEHHSLSKLSGMGLRCLLPCEGLL